jgi:uncharacterized protein YjbJ (UPF0337 family)
VKGTVDKVKGTLKYTAGKVTGDKQMESEGKVNKVKGSTHKVTGDVKDTVKESNK